MVSTRGGAQTGAPDAEMALKKKPVRKTTAKTTTAAAAPKARATRAKKVVPEPEVEVDDDQDELADLPPVPTKCATRRGRPPIKKGDKHSEQAPAPKRTTKAASTAKTTTKAARTTTTRTTKVKIDEEEQTEEPPQTRKAPELKALQSRATRPTRATAAKEKAAPLSPKKITQVSRAPMKIATTKLSFAEQANAKPAARGRPATRKRNVSDENAGVPQLKPSAEEVGATADSKHADTIAEKTSKIPSPRKFVLDDETPMSTRPTTPADSTQQVFDEPELDTQEARDEQPEDELQAEEGSDDELCAPKTPMKRCDPREQAKYSPAKGSQLPDVDGPLKTPVRGFHVLGTQQGTPRTQKPYCRPTVPLSEVRPMTAARARDMAMVFPRLQPLQSPQRSFPDAIEREVDVADAEPFAEQDSDMSLLVDASMQDAPIAGSDVAETVEHSNLEEIQQEHSALNTDETMIDEKMGESELDSQQDTSLDSIRSVIVIQQEIYAVAQSEDESNAVNKGNTTGRPATMAWESLREEVTIPFKFDGNASPTHTLPQVEATERLSIATNFMSNPVDRDNTDAGAGSESTLQALPVEIAFLPDMVVSRNSIGDNRMSLHATVNFSDFVNMSAMTDDRDETQADTDVNEASAEFDTVMARNSTVEDIIDDDSSAIDGDITLRCNEPETPLPATRTPIRLTTVEDVPEQSAAVDGDMTLMLGEPICPSTTTCSPVKLTTAEDYFEDDESVEGDMTLALDEPMCPRTIKRSPVKLTTAEDVPEHSDAVEGDMTLMLNSPLPPLPETPAILHETRSSNVTPLDLEATNTPRYARSTISSRRKSLSESSRPTTSHGNQLPVNTQPTVEAWFDKVESLAQGTPHRSRPSTAHGSHSRSQSLSRPRTPAATDHASLKTTPKERFPGLPAHQSYEELIGTPAAQSAPKEQFPGMPPAESYQELLNSPAAKTRADTQMEPAETPVTRGASLKRKSPHNEEIFEMPTVSKPRPALGERFPGMPSRATYEAHTAMPTTRSLIPTRQSPIKRPATTQRPTSLRKIALKAASTPIKAPLNRPVETPGHVSMTPHPSVPLRNVVALVDVYTHDGVCASQSFTILLKRLGAKTTKTFNENVTHVVYKEGGPSVLQALKLHNRQVAESGRGQEIFCVNSRWVNDCDAHGRRMPESDEEYAVEVDEHQRTAKRRRKSMEPMSLLKTIGGNIVRDRKSSAGRVSIGRSSIKGVFESPRESSMFNVADRENIEDGSEPATPAYLKEPSALIQQTVPAKKMRKLNFGDENKQRRLTFADGLEF